jgi:hypothetical protein
VISSVLPTDIFVEYVIGEDEGDGKYQAPMLWFHPIEKPFVRYKHVPPPVIQRLHDCEAKNVRPAQSVVSAFIFKSF